MCVIFFRVRCQKRENKTFYTHSVCQRNLAENFGSDNKLCQKI